MCCFCFVFIDLPAFYPYVLYTLNPGSRSSRSFKNGHAGGVMGWTWTCFFVTAGREGGQDAPSVFVFRLFSLKKEEEEALMITTTSIHVPKYVDRLQINI